MSWYYKRRDRQIGTEMHFKYKMKVEIHLEYVLPNGLCNIATNLKYKIPK